jgi:Tfp pilus assembly protein PilO
MIFDWKTETTRYHRYLATLRQIAQREDVRSWTNLTLSFLTIAFFGFFAIKPTLIIIAKLTKEIKDRQEVNLQLKKKIASLIAAQEQYSANQERFYLIDQALPQTPDFPSFLFCLEKEATSAGIKIQSFSITKIEIAQTQKAKPADQKSPSFEFNLALTGDYVNLQRFAGQIENLRRSLNLEKISFSKTKKEKEETPKIVLTIFGKSNFYEKTINK